MFGEHDQIVRSCIEEGGGTDIKNLGDGFMALFLSAGAAINAAVAIQRAIDERNQVNQDKQISVRIGINSGDVTQAEGDAHGTAVHAASRVAAKAQGGQILISQIVADLAGSIGTRVVDRGLFWLKGFPDRWRLYEVLWRQRDADDGQSRREVREVSEAAFDPYSPRAAGPIVGRVRELKVIRDQIASAASGGIRAVVLEGEAGIGKTRLMEAAAEMAESSEHRYVALDIAADEELRGPFLMFRSLFGSPRMAAVAREAMALESMDRAREAVSGGLASQSAGLSAPEQMLRVFDEVASAISALSREHPLALLFDDLQWADEDSTQLIRYLVRTLPTAPIFLLITVRPYSESSSVAGKLIADLDRMRLTEVFRLDRFTVSESAELLQNVLGFPVDDQAVRSLHSRSEGVPFFIEELARAYREADALQLMDGTWTMTRLSGPAVPSSIQSLIERRLAQLPDESRALLADSGVLGRRFRLSDLSPVLAQMRGEAEKPEWQLAEEFDEAVRVGLLIEEDESAKYDYSFSHDQIRASLLGDLPRRRQQAIHSAITETLSARGGDADLSMLAFHASKAGDTEKAVSSTLAASRSALALSAPEESLRLIDGTLPLVSVPSDRIELLRVKDEAFGLLDRGDDRIANLAEMAALTAAVDEPGLDAEVSLRRAAASRATEDYDTAIDLSTDIREKAAAAGDLDLELKACFELGQALTRTPVGEGYWPLGELDLEPADEAFTRALAISRQLGNRSQEAVALRELAVIEGGRVRNFAAEAEQQGTSKFEIIEMGSRLFEGAKSLAEQAFKIFEELGDQRGATSALISMAYSHITDPTAHGMAGRLEHIRALQNGQKGKVTDSQRASNDALMLYSIHTYARLNIQPDLALERGREAYEAARSLGDRWLEALAAGGMSSTYAACGLAEESSAWLERAAAAAMKSPSTAMARRVEMWRAICSAVRGEADEMAGHFGRAAELAGTKNPAGRAEATCALAMETCKLWAAGGEPELLERASQAAMTTLDLVASLEGDLPWGPVAHGVLAVVADSEGDDEHAAEQARLALSTLDGLTHIPHFVNVLWAAGRVLIRQEAPEAAELAAQIAQGLGFLSMNMTDPKIRQNWFDVSAHSELAQLAGFEAGEGFAGDSATVELSDEEMRTLRSITSGVDDPLVATSEVDDLLTMLGVGSETEAIQYAIKAGITWQ